MIWEQADNCQEGEKMTWQEQEEMTWEQAETWQEGEEMT